jgi:hypothetical protein
MSIDVLDLRNASLSDEAREKLCWRYYERVYKPAFPRLNEAEDPCVWLPFITLTEEGARRLPIVAACSAPKNRKIVGNVKTFGPELKVRVPGVVWTEWEGEFVDVQIVEGPRPANPRPGEQYLPPLEFACDFADTMAFFRSGHVAYSFSILFPPSSLQNPENQKNVRIPIYPTVILALLGIARSNTDTARTSGSVFPGVHYSRVSAISYLIGLVVWRPVLRWWQTISRRSFTMFFMPFWNLFAR